MTINTHSSRFFNEQNTKPIPDTYKPIIITDRFSTPSNLGNIIRLGANLGVKKIIILIDDIDLRDSKIKKTAGAAFDQVNIEKATIDNFRLLIPEYYLLTALETSDGSTNIFNTIMPEKMALVLGNEKNGISQELLSLCQLSVYIPMPGPIKSMNVSHAAAVCLFQWYNCIQQKLID